MSTSAWKKEKVDHIKSRGKINNKKMREETFRVSSKTCTSFYQRDNFSALFSALEINDANDELERNTETIWKFRVHINYLPHNKKVTNL